MVNKDIWNKWSLIHFLDVNNKKSKICGHKWRTIYAKHIFTEIIA